MTPAATSGNSENLPAFAEKIDGSIVESSAVFNQVTRVAKVFAASKLVPEAYRGNLADCFIAVNLARQLNVDPFMFMQNSYVVYGKPAMEGKLVIALINSRGPYKHGVRFRLSGEGDARKCVAWGERRNTGDVDEVEVSVKMAKDQGWWTKKDSKWPVMTDQMLRYRSAAFLARAYCPEVMMGLQTVEEVQDVNGVEVIGSGRSSAALQAAIKSSVPAEEPEPRKREQLNLTGER